MNNIYIIQFRTILIKNNSFKDDQAELETYLTLPQTDIYSLRLAVFDNNNGTWSQYSESENIDLINGNFRYKERCSLLESTHIFFRLKLYNRQ